MLSKSIVEELKDYVIRKSFPNMNYKDTEILAKYLYKLIDLIAEIYLESDSQLPIFINHIQKDNHAVGRWLLTLILPYINSKKKEMSSIKSLDDIYKKKSQNITSLTNNEGPEYTYSNIQYGRCKRGKEIEEISFSEEHINHTCKLLCQAIVRSSHRLYCNWTNILPIPLDDYKDSKLYQNTLNDHKNGELSELDIIKYVDYDNYPEAMYRRFYVSDIYNTITNDLYRCIKDTKWLIFDYRDPITNRLVDSLEVLNHHFKDEGRNLTVIERALNQEQWEYLSYNDKSYFGKKFYSLLTNLTRKGVENTGSDVVKIPGSMVSFLHGFYIYFGNNRELLKKAKKLMYEHGDITMDNNILYENGRRINSQRLYSVLINLRGRKDDRDDYGNYRLAYENIRNAFKRYQSSYYSIDRLYEDDNGLLRIKKQINREKITPKNIYNYAKGLSYHTEKNRELLPVFYEELNEKQRELIANRLNDNGYDDWFNVKGYIKNILKEKDVNSRNKEIYKNVSDIIIETVFKALIKKGELTRIDFSEKNETERMFSIDSKEAKGCYHFLTGKTYRATSIYGEHSYNSPDEANYMNFNKKSNWYTMAALNWVSQLGFCLRFLNNRVNYVTGATGVGKSTQVPKLYLYYLRSLEYKYKGKVVCTQPRKKPTSGNAERVSLELGVPIKVGSEDKKIETSYYYVQMKHSDSKHIDKYSNSLSLTFITDGSLYNDIISPDLRRSGIDVIIIDEAHEHNQYMDLIITGIRTPIYNNDSLRGVILSATIDDDEPGYRRYYRCINDNQMYPYSTWLEENLIDRINVDRRYHISPPDVSTRFPIKEIVKPNASVEDIIEEILKDSSIGDVLVFQPGQAEIMDTVKKLNKFTPDNVLAIPYFSKMDTDIREQVVDRIDMPDVRKNIKISKDKSFNNIDKLKEGSGKYNRFIIVATNIAEASITITSLRYVVDTGIQKVAKFDYRSLGSSIQEGPISDSSRTQRKGRVGRNAPGTVYYLYDPETTKSVKTFYAVSISDITDNLYKFLKSRSNEDEYILPKTFDYLGNSDHYDYDNNIPPPLFYETGYNIKDVMDNGCEFYAIHPEEPNLKRNIVGRVIGLVSDHDKGLSVKDNVINSEKINTFIKNMCIGYLITTNYEKTIYGELFMKLSAKLQLEDPRHNKMLFNQIILDKSKTYIMAGVIALLVKLKGKIKSLSLTKNINWIGKRLKTKGDIDSLAKISEKYDYSLIKLEKWCIQNNISFDTVKYSKKLRDSYIGIIERVVRKYKREFNIISLPLTTVSNSIIASAIMSYPHNICENIPGTHSYINLIKPKLNSIYTVPSFTKKRYIPQTTMSILDLTGTLIFLERGSFTDPNDIKMINWVNKEDLVVIKQYMTYTTSLHERITKLVNNDEEKNKIESRILYNFHKALLEVSKITKKTLNLPFPDDNLRTI